MEKSTMIMKKKLISFFIFSILFIVFVMSFASFAVKGLNTKNKSIEVELEKSVQIEQFLQEFYAAFAEKRESIERFFLDETISFYSQDDFFKGYEQLSYNASTDTDFFYAVEKIYKVTGPCIEYTVNTIDFVEESYDALPKSNLYYVDIYIAYNSIQSHHYFYINCTGSELKIYRYWIDFIR